MNILDFGPENKSGRWVAPVVLGVLGVCGLGGVLLVVRAFGLFEDGEVGKGLGMAGVGVVFALIGFGVMVLSISGRREAAARNRLLAENPGKPWLTRKDWAKGQITDDSARTIVWSWGFALFWNLISTPAAVIAFSEYWEKNDPILLIILLFPLIGAVLILSSVYYTLRWWKFGRSTFEMAGVPGVIGGDLGGIIHTRVKIREERGFRITLACVRRYQSGENTEEEVFWEEVQEITQEALRDDPTRSAIPVLFSVPYTCPQTNSGGGGNDEIAWRLTVEARVPGVNFKAKFEVPVFKTAESRPDDAMPPAGHDPLKRYRREVKIEERLAAAGVRKGLSKDGGMEYRFPAARHKGMAAVMTMLFLIFALIMGVLILKKAPFPVILVLAVFVLIFGYTALSAWFSRGAISILPDRLKLVTRYVFFVSSNEMHYEELDGIEIKSMMSSGETSYYDFEVYSKEGRPFLVEAKIKGRDNTAAILEEIEREIGKRAPHLF